MSELSELFDVDDHPTMNCSSSRQVVAIGRTSYQH